MRIRSVLLSLLSATILSACIEDKDYDLENLDLEFTPFQEEISVPVGSIGPISLRDILGDALSPILSSGDDGRLWNESESDIYTVSAFEIASKMENPSAGGDWVIGDRSTNISGISGLLRLFGVKSLNQHIEVYVRNPLKRFVDLEVGLKAYYTDSSFDEVEAGSWDIKETAYSRGETKIAEIEFTSDLISGLKKVALDSIVLKLPAGWVDQIPENSDSHFTFYYKYKCNIAFAGNFSFEQTVPLRKVSVALGQFKLKDCEITTTIENTLPFDLTLTGLKVFKGDDSGEYDENIQISHDIHIAAGKQGEPSVTPASFHVQASQGTIPDLHGLEFSAAFKVAPNSDASPLYMEQGLYLRNISAKVKGGITINLNDNE